MYTQKILQEIFLVLMKMRIYLANARSSTCDFITKRIQILISKLSTFNQILHIIQR